MLDELPIRVLKPIGPLFFGSVEPMIESYIRTKEHELLIVDLTKVSMIDLTGAFALEDLIKNSLKKNTEIFITNINPKIERILQDLDFDKNVGVSNFHVSKKTIMPILEKRYDFLSRSQL
jgi:SulP family sulfate permease